MSKAKPRKCREDCATYYARFFHGRKTASGEIYNHEALTAAHRTIPFGTKVKVTNKWNGQSVIVKVNDRGPWAGPKRILDLSGAAARKINIVKEGVVPVEVTVLSPSDKAATPAKALKTQGNGQSAKGKGEQDVPKIGGEIIVSKAASKAPLKTQTASKTPAIAECPVRTSLAPAPKSTEHLTKCEKLSPALVGSEKSAAATRAELVGPNGGTEDSHIWPSQAPQVTTSTTGAQSKVADDLVSVEFHGADATSFWSVTGTGEDRAAEHDVGPAALVARPTRAQPHPEQGMGTDGGGALGTMSWGLFGGVISALQDVGGLFFGSSNAMRVAEMRPCAGRGVPNIVSSAPDLNPSAAATPVSLMPPPAAAVVAPEDEWSVDAATLARLNASGLGAIVEPTREQAPLMDSLSDSLPTLAPPLMPPPPPPQSDFFELRLGAPRSTAGTPATMPHSTTGTASPSGGMSTWEGGVEDRPRISVGGRSAAGMGMAMAMASGPSAVHSTQSELECMLSLGRSGRSCGTDNGFGIGHRMRPWPQSAGDMCELAMP